MSISKWTPITTGKRKQFILAIMGDVSGKKPPNMRKWCRERGMTWDNVDDLVEVIQVFSSTFSRKVETLQKNTQGEMT